MHHMQSLKNMDSKTSVQAYVNPYPRILIWLSHCIKVACSRIILTY